MVEWGARLPDTGSGVDCREYLGAQGGDEADLVPHQTGDRDLADAARI